MLGGRAVIKIKNLWPDFVTPLQFLVYLFLCVFVNGELNKV